MSRIGQRLYPNGSGDRPQTSAYPYAQIESGDESPFNTMGEPTDTKWGSIAQLTIRCASQSRSEGDVAQIASDVRRVLDGAAFSLSGYGSASLDFVQTLPLPADAEAGIVTREWLVIYEITAHQGS